MSDERLMYVQFMSCPGRTTSLTMLTTKAVIAMNVRIANM